MNRWMIGLPLCVSLFFSSFAFTQQTITKLIDLNYCEADKVLTLIQPLLKPGDKVSASGKQMVVSVSPDTMTQIRTIIHQLDQPPVTFQVFLHQGSPDWINTQDDDVISSTAPSNDALQQNQSVNVLSGSSAFVSTGKTVPIITSVGAGWNAGISYQQREAASGLLVQPTMEGSQVKLRVKRLREQENPQQQQQFDNQQIDTTMMVPLDQWVSLGSAQGAATPSTSEVYSAGNKFSRTATIYIKVSVLGQGAG